MNQFDEIHKQYFNTKAPDLGYPDTGCGKYSDKLAYKGWFTMNCAQRTHLNYLEGVTFIVVVSLIAGIQYPLYAFVG